MKKTKRDPTKKTYSLAVLGGVTLYTTVEASDLSEAIELARERGVQGLCHQCSGNDGASVWSLTGELDADPTGCELTDVLVDGVSLEGELFKACKEQWSGE